MSKYPEAFDPSVNPELVFSGSKGLLDDVAGAPINAGKLVLSPTRTYAPVIKKILDQLGKEVHGMVHCSGGAQTKVLHFIENLKVIKDNLLPIPPLFHLIQGESGTGWKEMYQVFNMGHRFELYTDPKRAQDIIDIAASFNIEAKIVGSVEAANIKEVEIKSEKGTFNYF